MKLKKPIYILLIALIAILIFTSGGLFKKAIDYKKENRKLILQNDSLQAVVISLNRSMYDSVNLRMREKKRVKKRILN
jgi:hypothetical protein